MTELAPIGARATFSPDVYRERRTALRRRIPDGIIIFAGARNAPMNFVSNVYPFVQDSCFRYFFGLNQPDLIGVIDVESGNDILFGAKLTLDELIWLGKSPSLAELGHISGATTKPLEDAPSYFSEVLRSGRRMHYPPPHRAETTIQLSGWLQRAPSSIAAGASIELIRAVVALREIKATNEIAEMEEGLAVTARIHCLAMARSLPGVLEREVVGAMEQIIRSEGLSPAYAPIFSRRGEVILNHAYSGRLQAGDLVINDTGVTGSVGYASDITRTLPIGGRFSDCQRELYAIVLSAQTDAIAAMGPGSSFLSIHKRAALRLTEGLIAIGLLRGDPAELVEDGVHAVLFQTGLGHQIGLDVHDMEALGEDHVGYGDGPSRSAQFGLNHLRMARPLKPGMVMTVEPGLYFIPELIERWEAERRFSGAVMYDRLRTFLGVGGLRIEDNLLVTESGTRMLGPPIPRTIVEVEAAMGS